MANPTRSNTNDNRSCLTRAVQNTKLNLIEKAVGYTPLTAFIMEL